MRHFIISTMLVALAGFGAVAHGAAEAEPGKTLTWVGCGITKKAFMQELAAAYEKKTGIKIDIHGGGATKGIRQVATGEADIGGSCRYKIDGEAAETGSELHPVAWDALAVIVHKDNPIKDITLAQVRDLYLGKITNWKELGGNDSPIDLYARKGKISGVGRALRELVFADYDQDFVAKHYVKSSGPLEKAVEADVNAVGVTGISSARKRNVKIVALEGKEPTYENIKSGDYLLYRPLYLAASPASANYADVKEFIEFAHSAEGRKIIRENDTVPYRDAMVLVMKQLEQARRARELGLYRR
jgi:phosphate transport system substrate-binding protein